MKKNLLFILIIVSVSFISAFAQQKVKDHTLSGEVLPDKDALLELESANKGLLHARVQLIQSDDAAPLSQHRAGMMVYNTATVNDVVPGIYYNNGNRWILVAGGGVTPINYNPVTYELTYVDIKGDTHTINLEEVVKAVETVTVLGYDAVAHRLIYQDEDGNTHPLDLEVGTLSYDPAANALTYTDEEGNATPLTLNNTSLAYDPATGVLTYTNSLGVTQTADLSDIVNSLETLTVMGYDPTTHQLTYQDEDGNTQSVDLSPYLDNTDDQQISDFSISGNTLTLTLEDGGTQSVDLSAYFTEASNGLHIETVDPTTEGHVKLGGPLTKETTIVTDATNTLAITGLQPGNLDQDNLLMADANGVLKTVSTNKFVRFFYMPSVVFDTSNPDPTGPMRTKNLYQEYVNQFTGAGTPGLVRSTDAPATIPYLPQADDLYYYITYYDDDVFADLGIDENGVLSYRVIGPGTPTSFMNIVFVIKE